MVVGVELQEQALGQITVKPSDGKVRVISHGADSLGVLQGERHVMRGRFFQQENNKNGIQFCEQMDNTYLNSCTV